MVVVWEDEWAATMDVQMEVETVQGLAQEKVAGSVALMEQEWGYEWVDL
jgi:hypothetical protein